MKKIFNIYVFSILITFTSCDDYLDVEPIGLVVPENVEHFDLLLNGERNIVFTSDQDDLVISANDFVPGTFSFGNLDDPSNQTLQLFSWNSDLYTDSDPKQIWSLPYANIYTFNSVANSVENASLVPTYVEGDKVRIKAEAQTQRAFEYWMLVNSFAKQYDASTAASDLGVPLVTTADVSQTTPQRSTVQEIYDFILKDLEEAVVNLSSEPVNLARPSKGAAYAMLSRVKLYMGAYAEAITYADLALAENSFIADYTVGIDDLEDENYMRKMMGVGLGYRGGPLTSSLVNIFDATDARLTELTRDNFNGDGTTIITSIFTQRVTIWPTVPEVHLIKAECNVRLNNDSAAIDDLNTVRVKRIPAYTNLTDADFVSNAELLAFTLEEKRRETFRMNLRWFELKRLNLEPATATTLVHTLPDGVTSFTLTPGANNWVFPIPQQVLNFADLEQNPRD
ncbi:RagB/SusD family nutrient uptake outer membrane protein [Flavivirga spongiicola]|uniref:RagB/SusD family nutrient uptake outer membrane protein n=1 Tax=Flavivirga spongiicola TaxID=421621 RepID=A0ABU7XTR1_9FLAO|nr:RagB/SusD family nutrient uptake outer membrane protein [Flavivirga sp. MEBiC05379]MDO5979180.1 RagB/SusD family nutrient uptake outer membrane protein [Flavivirga sp. MEBiC05379]